MIDNDITDDELFLQANTNSEISDLSRLEEKYGLTADQILMRGFAIKLKSHIRNSRKTRHH